MDNPEATGPTPPPRGAFARFLSTEPDWAAFAARIALGGVMFPHGAQKLFGWWGGGGFAATMAAFTEKSGIPAPLAFLVIMAESLGALGLVAGLLGRFQAAGIAMVMLGAIFLVHLKNGFFSKDGGIEYHLLMLGLAAVVMIRGSGAFSIDRWIARKI